MDDPEHPNTIRLTYVQIATRLGISVGAVRILARRRGWRRVASNRRGGATLVVVPEDALEAELSTRTSQDVEVDASHTSMDVPLDARVDRAEQRADEANRRADAALALAAEANARAERDRLRFEATLAELKTAHADDRGRLEAELQALEAALKDATTKDSDRRAQGRWARLRQAWRGSD
jgi:hypothetical protein